MTGLSDKQSDLTEEISRDQQRKLPWIVMETSPAAHKVVRGGSLTVVKISNSVKLRVKNVYVTKEEVLESVEAIVPGVVEMS